MATPRPTEKDLTDRRRFELPAERFEAFAALLDEPVRDAPKLRETLAAPTPFDDAA